MRLWKLFAILYIACFAVHAEDAAYPEPRFDKRGDLVLEGDGHRWLSYKDFHFRVVPPRSILAKDPQNRFEPFAETRQQVKDGDEIESDKELLKRMAARAKEAVKAAEKARKEREEAAKEQAKATQKAREKQEKLAREAAEKEQERLEAERAAREGYPVRTESGLPIFFNFGIGINLGPDCHRPHYHRRR